MQCSKCKNALYEDILITITDKNTETVYCPNCLLLEQLNGTLILENNPEFIDDITGEKGAIKYESKHESYTLEKETLARLILVHLTPEEYFALSAKYSPHNFSLHDDFYDPIDGSAIQPADDDNY